MSLGRWAPAAAAAAAPSPRQRRSAATVAVVRIWRREQSEEGKARKDGFLKPSGFCSSHKGHEIRWNKKVSFFKALPSMAARLMALTLAYRNRAWERATFSQVDHAAYTHIVAPLDLLGGGPGVDGALEVDVVVLLQVGRVQRPA